MSKILGIDLGTNSIGLAIRDTDKGETFVEQMDFFSSIIFKSGVGSGKSGEFSYAAERTKARSIRRLYQSRKYRIWATLALLIEHKYCPLSMEDLDKWRRYDKEKELKRQYPVDAIKFEQWVRLDFDGDGKPDYTNPYELRAEIMQKQFDFNSEIDRYKLGRILYHIAQRRGFKSSKGETLKELSEKEMNEDLDLSDALQKSEEKKSQKLKDFMKTHNIPTVGWAFYELTKQGIRIKESEYQAVRIQYKEEIQKIFEFQKGLDINSAFYKHIMSEKKNEGTIFYKRPLRSQKGKVGTCTLEQGKTRCPISHPEFEEYRAWSFINNIKYRTSTTAEWQTLSLKLKEELFKDKFLRTKSYFKFEEIKNWLSAKLSIQLECNDKKENSTINYKDKTNVIGCPISARLKNILGEDYKQWKFKSDKERTNLKTGEVHRIIYNYIDIWHICFFFDEAEFVEEFAKDSLKFDNKQAKQLCTLHNNIQQDYASLSLKAIRNINPFLQKGLIYTDAVLLAKLPEIFKDKWCEIEDDVIADIDNIIKENRYQKEISDIVNDLIADYKSLDYNERFAEHNTEYILQNQDYTDIENKLKSHFGEKTWITKPCEEQEQIRKDVCELYQIFFGNSTRDYFKQPKVSESLAEYLKNKYTYLNDDDLKKIYHPSMIEIYPIAKKEIIDGDKSVRRLGSPVIGALKNPMAMRILHTLRSQINKLIDESKIDEHTRIVVETAREVNDANKRWAIEEYQRKQEEENKEIEKIISKYFEEGNISDNDIRKAKVLLDQFDIEKDDKQAKGEKTKSDDKLSDTWSKVKSDNIKKYKLWLEQNCCCMYTGKVITISELFDGDKFDIEHTIPRSVSFDDSLSNLTICESYFNRSIKKNQLPTQLDNYNEIEARLETWRKKVLSLKDRVNFWKEQSKRAQTKDRKDQCIRQRLLWQMELDYWKKKLASFTITEFIDSFRNNQLNDTRIITKYAFHYLKTVFEHVSVQRGEITSNFRKIVGIQKEDEKKDRSNHSHHAIDAAILTLIPSAKQRNRILETFYQMKESKETNDKDKFEKTTKELEKAKRAALIPDAVAAIKDHIEQNIFVNHISKDQTLTPAKRRKRIRGKIDKNKQWIITGDCIRGSLHKDSFYGKIDLDGKETYVIRRPLKIKKSKIDKGFNGWEDLEKVMVDKHLFETIRNQFDENTKLDQAISQGIYMPNKNEEKIRIRHIRCIAPQNQHYIQIKEQMYKSKKEQKNNFKQYYYAASDDMYTMCKYENKRTKESKYIPYDLFETAKNHKITHEFIPSKYDDKVLTQQLVKGDMLLIYKDNPNELFEMDNVQLSKRLYTIDGFERDGRIRIIHSSNAQSDKLGNGESIKDFNCLPQKIRQGISSIHYLLRGVDFEIINGRIEFLNKTKYYD